MLKTSLLIMGLLMILPPFLLLYLLHHYLLTLFSLYLFLHYVFHMHLLLFHYILHPKLLRMSYIIGLCRLCEVVIDSFWSSGAAHLLEIVHGLVLSFIVLIQFLWSAMRIFTLPKANSSQSRKNDRN